MFQNSLFTFTDTIIDNDIVKTNIRLNPRHPIFSGHFPGSPILPGVCIMQMVKELLETYLKKPTRLITGEDLKFLIAIVPEEDKLLGLELKIGIVNGQIKVIALLSDSGNPAFKFKGVFGDF